MANYHTPTVVQQPIPAKDVTALERLILGQVFDLFEEEGGITLSSEEGACGIVILEREPLRAALADPACAGTSALHEVLEQLREGWPADGDIELDCSNDNWLAMLQDVIKRSASIDHLTVVSAWTCDRMRCDGFGGAVDLITASGLRGSNTQDLIDRFIAEAVEANEMKPIA